VRLTTSLCKKKFVENLLKNPRRGQGSYLGCGATDDDGDKLKVTSCTWDKVTAVHSKTLEFTRTETFTNFLLSIAGHCACNQTWGLQNMTDPYIIE
jgi:hypothetical protein